MTHQLVVTKPFLNYKRGDIIADAAKVAGVLTAEYKKFVTKITESTQAKG